jgi:NAD(P)-dependent dehydrogenase (short-subunit alcohol dehydrogenase family)
VVAWGAITMRRILVTGANKGIGRAIVEAILDEHADTFVYLGARDPARGRSARQEIVDEHAAWAERIEVLPLDVASDDSVVAARAQTTSLDAIVNNAGIGGGERATVLNVNVEGVRRVCEAFIDLLPDGGRIVNITSASGPMFVSTCTPERQRFFQDANVTLAQLRSFIDECSRLRDEDFAARGLADGNAYGLSKACANLYTLILARTHPRLRINACTPGYIETDMTRPHANTTGRSPAEMGMKPPSAGARAPMHLLFGDIEGTGHYYGSDAVRSPLDRYRAPGSAPHRD